MQQDPRRTSPRIGIEALCWEVIGERELSSLVVDLSAEGARLERPYVPAGYREPSLELGPAGRSTYTAPPPRPAHLERVVPLQIEVPGIDEVMWARGDIVFDELVPAPRERGGPFGLLRRTGFHITLAASRDMRLLHDYVWEMHAKRQVIVENENALEWSRAFG
jgi:hypothetical protein